MKSGLNMIVSQIGAVDSANYNDRKISFKAIHPCRYFIKDSHNQLVQVVSMDQIKILQRKLISMLNKGDKDTFRKSSKVLKSSSSDSNAIRERLVKFFKNNDRDYFNRNVVRSFYFQSPNGAKSFIVSGNLVDFIDNVAKPIGKKKNMINQKLDKISDYYGINKEQAKSYLQGSLMELKEVTGQYQNAVASAINKNLAKNNPEDKIFDAYFVPVVKGKKVDYQLFHADFITQW